MILSSAQSSRDRRTHFASPERDDAFHLRLQAELVGNSPFMDGVLKSTGGLLLILNEHRQIVAVNDALLRDLDLANADELLGLRPGEAVHCEHADEMPDGCGTSKFCSGCGAAVAIVATLTEDEPFERDCALTVLRNGASEDLFFHVRSCPARLGNSQFVLLIMQDYTAEARQACLERVFLHDMANIVTGLRGIVDGLDPSNAVNVQRSVYHLRDLSNRLGKEFAIHRAMRCQSDDQVAVCLEHVPVSHVLVELQQVVLPHPSARGKHLAVGVAPSGLLVLTDLALLVRVLMNMVVNAFEATDPKGEIRLSLDVSDHEVVFCVWNAGSMPDPVKHRVFQKYFTTKTGPGRGIGAYAMKLIGESYLGGKLSFSSSAEEGTTFRLALGRV
jgi:hypothetical protein